MAETELCSIKGCEEEELVGGWCLDHAMEHADEIPIPTADELLAAERESLDALYEALDVERPGPQSDPGRRRPPNPREGDSNDRGQRY